MPLFVMSGRIGFRAALILLSALLADSAIVSSPARADFLFSDFSNTEGLALVGDAAPFGNALRLTPSAFRKKGAVWYIERQQMTRFETEFAFSVSSLHGPGADGLAFVIQGQSTSAIGDYGGYMGYSSIAPSIAIEFDTFRNSEFNDPNDNHVSVQTRGQQPNSPHHQYSIASSATLPNLSDETIHVARIRYVDGILRVFLDSIVDPVIEVGVDIAALLGLPDNLAWVGFTSATATYYENHDIHSWSYSGLPSAPRDAGISGRVLDAFNYSEFGQALPLRNVVVRATNLSTLEGFTTTTDLDGHFVPVQLKRDTLRLHSMEQGGITDEQEASSTDVRAGREGSHPAPAFGRQDGRLRPV